MFSTETPQFGRALSPRAPYWIARKTFAITATGGLGDAALPHSTMRVSLPLHLAALRQRSNSSETPAPDGDGNSGLRSCRAWRVPVAETDS